ncbi:hypothetical protein [Roseibium salinum]|uniref:Uncharacterized protein n=1 Tax=Roseibium salinum TaxID=1604349 RepID=A0ABT3R4F5_9HYPH|nr:hypothetical protein [Roseibium sp. DSM 29163]MCX2724078.1 hypothetical protein [Roseibium sp. DSM 29163]
MNRLLGKCFVGLFSSGFFFALILPAAAIDLNLGVANASVSTANGVNVDAGANLGGASARTSNSIGGSGSLVDSNTNANVGSLSANSRTTVGGSENLASSNTTASVGITSANVGASVGTGSANANLTIGTTGGEEGESGSGNSGFFSRMFAGDRDDAARRAVDGLTDKQIARYKVMCADILSNANSWDRDLVQMCQAMQ